MKITVETSKLKDMVNKALKGAGNDPLYPITGMMWIYTKGSTLTMVTTDGTQYLYIKDTDKAYKKNFDVVAPVETFSRLVQKLTSITTILEVKDDVLEVQGNGSYKIELTLDGDKPITYPNPIEGIELKSDDTLNMDVVRRILASVKQSLAVEITIPVITNYYVGDSVLATNKNVVTSLDEALFGGYETLVSPKYMNLLDVITSDKVHYICKDEFTVVYSDDVVVYGVNGMDLNDYPINKLLEYVQMDFDSSCNVHKNLLLEALDRISLFVGAFGDTTISLKFADDGLIVYNDLGSSTELVEYTETSSVDEFECNIDLQMLTPQIKAYPEDVVEIQYGHDNCIKLVSDGMIQIISLKD